MTDATLKKLGLAVLDTEATAIDALKSRVDDDFVRACHYMLECEGRVVVIGMGKSGHIGSKIAATLASTGTPAFFVHPGEASHGDLGMITAKDVVIALSNSGSTEEILTILPIIKRLDVPLISMTGNPDSPLASAASVNLDVSVEKEACPLDLAPTASTTAALAMGDALAISLLEVRGFTADDFARSHPGGKLGRRLLLLIDDLIHTGDRVPYVPKGTIICDALLEMTQKGLGATAVVNDENRVEGIFTDGDLRRALDNDIDLHKTPIDEVMTRNCTLISPGLLAAEALKIMEDGKFNALLVVDNDNHLIGALNMHDLLRAGVV
ncbi:arabinose-5-phosphate isomerase [Thiogranum longum]|uniref:Arabinose 5-phosphate isomerase n=1 Tax=Thiogranum longum TaxID=1537524 RepID=A0A4R1HBK7_9GAMM|nr:KpsF/GutQ family sugar-phosphate isomerase [Thiogranum longum]TCK17560.1 arabinose-5-phosphate isomerase [Thiogranum longum]